MRSVVREKTDRGPFIRMLREKGYGLVLATNPIFPAVAVETRLGWVGPLAGRRHWLRWTVHSSMP